MGKPPRKISSGVLLCNLESLIQKLLSSNPVGAVVNEGGASRDSISAVSSGAISLVSRGVILVSNAAVLSDQSSTLSALQIAKYIGQISAGNNNSLICSNIQRTYCPDSSSINSDLVSLSQSVYKVGLGSVSAKYEVERTVQVVLNVNNQQSYVTGEVATECPERTLRSGSCRCRKSSAS